MKATSSFVLTLKQFSSIALLLHIGLLRLTEARTLSFLEPGSFGRRDVMLGSELPETALAETPMGSFSQVPMQQPPPAPVRVYPPSTLPSPTSNPLSPTPPYGLPSPASNPLSPTPPSVLPSPASNPLSPPPPSALPSPTSNPLSPPPPSALPSPASNPLSPPPPSALPSPTSNLSPPPPTLVSPPQSQPSPPTSNKTPPARNPTVPVMPPPAGNKPKSEAWCVAKPTVSDPILQRALDYACGTGADCKMIQPGGPCFQPNTVSAHSSFAFNSYWQKGKVAGGTCDFGGTAMIVTIDPSYNGCHFMSN